MNNYKPFYGSDDEETTPTGATPGGPEHDDGKPSETEINEFEEYEKHEKETKKN